MSKKSIWYEININQLTVNAVCISKFTSEKVVISSQDGFDVEEPIKSFFFQYCPNIVSAAKVLATATDRRLEKLQGEIDILNREKRKFVRLKKGFILSIQRFIPKGISPISSAEIVVYSICALCARL